MEHSHEETWEEFLDEFVDVFSIFDLLKYKIFICGSYSEANFPSLIQIKEILSKREKTLAFFEKEFRRTHSENLILKFDLIAKFSDEIIMVLEHDKGGQMIEMGIIVAFPEFYNKTKVFVLKNVEMTHMLKKGGLLNPFFKLGHDLFYYNDREELQSIIKKIYLSYYN
ncbi:MAG: hypothetical protein ACFFFB_06215 [Candidatus Heimdallarchaeota archaeon]